MRNYAAEWAPFWDYYDNYAKGQPASHPSRTLVQKVNGAKLLQDLQTLNNYHDLVDSFVTKVRAAKQHRPPNPDAEEELDVRGKQLCEGNVIKPYGKAGQAALQAFDTLVEAAAVRVQQKKPDSTEVVILTKMMPKVKELSAALREELEQFVTNTPATVARLRRDS